MSKTKIKKIYNKKEIDKVLTSLLGKNVILYLYKNGLNGWFCGKLQNAKLTILPSKSYDIILNKKSFFTFKAKNVTVLKIVNRKKDKYYIYIEPSSAHPKDKS